MIRYRCGGNREREEDGATKDRRANDKSESSLMICMILTYIWVLARRTDKYLGRRKDE